MSRTISDPSVKQQAKTPEQKLAKLRDYFRAKAAGYRGNQLRKRTGMMPCTVREMAASIDFKL
jgi:hypothetical protein